MMGKPVLRDSPGCSHNCPKCDIKCAILAGEAADAWREVERCRQYQALRPSPEQLAMLLRAREHLQASERDFALARPVLVRDRKSVVSGKSVSVRVALGGRRIIKKKKTTM